MILEACASVGAQTRPENERVMRLPGYRATPLEPSVRPGDTLRLQAPLAMSRREVTHGRGGARGAPQEAAAALTLADICPVTWRGLRRPTLSGRDAGPAEVC
jgi:hypothetical protein